MERPDVQARPTQRPLAFWLKRLDELLDTTFADALADEGLTRRHWQVLDVVSDEPAPTTYLVDLLRSFSNSAGVDEVITELVSRGWLTQADGGTWDLTGTGRSAHARVGERVGAVRRRMTAGVSESDFTTAQSVLETMCANLAQAS